MKTLKKTIKNLITRLLFDSIYEILEEKITEKFEHYILIFINHEFVESRGMIVVPNAGDYITLSDGREVKVYQRIIVSELGHEIRLYCSKI